MPKSLIPGKTVFGKNPISPHFLHGGRKRDTFPEKTVVGTAGKRE